MITRRTTLSARRLADAAAEIGSLWRVDWAECIDALTEGE